MNIEDNISLGDKNRDRKLRVLFVGPYRQPDSWGFLSRSIISSLLAIKNIDLTTRPIFLAQSGPSPVDPAIFRCESNKQPSYNVLMQHTLPDLMVSNDTFGLNVGITSFETKNNIQWDNHLRFLDRIFVSTEAEKDCISDHLQDKAHSIGGVVAGVDPSLKQMSNRFTFYTFAEGLDTKGGLVSLLQAYMSEFHVNEGVTLVIKTKNTQGAQELINATVSGLGIYNNKHYPHIHLIEDSPDDALHKQCQCLVDASKTRGFKEETAKALLYGNPPIILKGSGMDEYINDSNGWVVKAAESILICPDRPIPNVFTARESCLMVDTLDLAKCMRGAFDSHTLYAKKSSKGKDCSSSFALEKQSALIKEALCR